MATVNSFLFIPDISGFTEFIHETEIRHSQHIISELLEILIDSNQLDMILAEIEGDALFFYKEGHIPTVENIFSQAKRMYLNFHHHLQLYEKKRICQCGACSTASKLTLKFVAHGGTFQYINVKGKEKPIGADVITVHRLLKNQIPSDEYVLITDQIVENDKTIHSNQYEKGSELYDKTNQVDYHYLDIGNYRSELPDLPEVVVDQIDKKYRIRVEGEIQAPVLDLYELITNFNLRMLWNKDANSIKYNESEINQLGSKHTCVFDNRNIDFSTITQSLEEGKWVYGEQTEDIPLMKRANTYFILSPKGSGSILLIDAYMQPAGIIGKILFPLIKNKVRKTLFGVLENVKEVAEKFSIQEIYDLVETHEQSS